MQFLDFLDLLQNILFCTRKIICYFQWDFRRKQEPDLVHDWSSFADQNVVFFLSFTLMKLRLKRLNGGHPNKCISDYKKYRNVKIRPLLVCCATNDIVHQMNYIIDIVYPSVFCLSLIFNRKRTTEWIFIFLMLTSL